MEMNTETTFVLAQVESKILVNIFCANEAPIVILFVKVEY